MMLVEEREHSKLLNGYMECINLQLIEKLLISDLDCPVGY